MYKRIDIEMALGHLGGSERLYKKVVVGFYERYKEVDLQIERLLIDGDAEGARRLAHSLKGLCGNLGSLDLREKSLDLEMSIRDERADRHTCLLAFSQTLKEVVEEVESILRDRYGYDEGQEIKKSESGLGWASALLALANALDSCRYSDVKEALNRLEGHDVPENNLEEVSEARAYIAAFDYESANTLIRKLIANG